MAKSQQDKWANTAAASLTMSAANAMTYQKLATNISLFEKVGWSIHRIEYHVDVATLALMTATTDWINVGVTLSDQLTVIHPNQRGVVDSHFLTRNDFGAAATTVEEIRFMNVPEFVTDFSTFPSGGYLIPAEPLYIGMDSAGLASAGVLRARIYFSVIRLTVQEYWDLAEAVRLVV